MGGSQRVSDSRGVRLAVLALCAMVWTAAWAVAPAQATTQTFGYTGTEQTFTIPAGILGVHVVAIGGSGGASSAAGGAAAQVTADLSVTPGQTLYVEVGGIGQSSGGGGGGGFNGGAPGSAGGGGASDVRTSPRSAGLAPDDRLLVAGGGGGGGATGQENAGGAGGAAGSAGANETIGERGTGGGGAGSQSTGGSGGSGCGEGTAGQLGLGGSGGNHGTPSNAPGGGGGGGYYGGGGGGGSCVASGAGGGGGSSLVPAGGSVTLASLTTPPQVQISYTPTSPTPLQSSSPPIVSRTNESAKRWRESNTLAQISAARKMRPPIGTSFSFVLNELATVTFSFTQPRAGRKVHGQCVAQTRKNRRKPHCVVVHVAGTFTFEAHPGANEVRFAGRISATKKLAPGPYGLQITAINAQGKRSAPRALSFTIVK